jgi:hypothetical protein
MGVSELLLVLARAVILRIESRGAHDHILLDPRFSQPGGPGPRICIPQVQGSPVIPPGTVFIFHRLLRLAWLRCGYSYPLPQGPHRKRSVQQFCCCCICILCRGNVFTEPLPRNDGRLQRHTNWWEVFTKYTVEIGGYRDTQTAWWPHKSTSIFFK